MREKPIARNGGHYMVTFDPNICATDPAKHQIIDWDIRLANRLLTTGSVRPVVGEYKWVDSFGPMIERIKKAFALTGKAQDVSFDTETMTFHPWYPDREIVTIQFTFERGTAEVLYCGSHQIPPVRTRPEIDRHAEIEWLLNSPLVKLRGGNAKFDLIWVAEKWGIECTNLAFDNLLAGSLLDENRSNSLNIHAKLFTPIGGYDDDFNRVVDKSHMELLPPDRRLLVYAGGDSDATQTTSDVLREQMLDEPGLAHFYVTILHPAARAFERIERRGVCLDAEMYRGISEELTVEINRLQHDAMLKLGGRLIAKHREKIAKQVDDGKDPLVPMILRDYFFSPQGLNLKPRVTTNKSTEENQVATLAMSHLRMFSQPDAVAMVETLSALNSAKKMKSTFVDGFLNHLRPDGRLHPSYMLFHGAYNDDDADESGSVTGRLAAKDPSINTLPKKKAKSGINWAKRLREAFIAPPGKCVLNIDYSQGELRVVACLADETTMLDSYSKGYDLHAVTGAKLGEIELALFLSYKDHVDKTLAQKFDTLRDNAKPMNFGLLYGMSPQGFRQYAWALYGKIFSEAEAEAMHAAFFELYPRLLDYHASMKKWVHKEGQVESPLGRIRHLPHIHSWDREVVSSAQRQAINSPVQSTLTDMMIWALSIIEREYGKNKDLEVVAMIHDALIAYVPIADAAIWAKRLTEIMSNLPFHEFGWEPQLKFPADAAAGPNFANLVPIKLAA